MEANMKLFKGLVLIMFLAIVFTACKKDINNPNTPASKTIDELNIPEGFNWSTTQKIALTVGVQTTQAVNLKSKISVFNGDPSTGGKLILTGAAKNDTPFTENLMIPSYLKEIYLVKEDAFGEKAIAMVQIDGSEIDYTFTETKSTPAGSGFKETGDIGPACDNCTLEISGNGNYEIGNGQTLCVTSTFTGNITFVSWNGGGTLKICGNATIASLQLTQNANVIVTQNGSLTVGSLSAWGTNSTIKVYENAKLIANGAFMTSGDYVENQGRMTINGNLTVQALANGFTNSGVLTVNGYFNLNSETLINSDSLKVVGSSFYLNNNSQITNNGVITFITTANKFEVNTSVLNNYGELHVIGNMSFNASSVVANSCGIICSGILEINSSNFINNFGYLNGAQEVKVNSTGTIQLNDHSMISTVNLTYNQGTILGGGALNSIKVTGTFSLFTLNTYVSGLIETVCESFYYGQGNQASHFINGATVVDFRGVSNYIPVSGCNPEGHGSLPMQDADGDGVSDDLDEYPEDYTRAFNSFFPGEGSYASVVFEDLWPAKGDYDFNDLVLGVSGTEVTNANDELVDIYINFNVRAVGASLQNGFGWQFAGITPDMISSVTGAVLEQGYVVNAANGTELGQDSAVIIACENVEDVLHRTGGSMFNTIENGFVGTSDLIEIHIIFNPAINRNLVGAEAYNVFLIKNQDRSVEVHLPNRVPTDKMNMSLLGTSQDASDINTGTYFRTATGLPWGMLLLEPYDYSVEKNEITQAYLHFAEWAESGGVVYQDWYSNHGSGYRDNIKIFGAQ